MNPYHATTQYATRTAKLRQEFEQLIGKRKRFATEKPNGCYGVMIGNVVVQQQTIRSWWKRGWIEPDGEHAWAVLR